MQLLHDQPSFHKLKMIMIIKLRKMLHIMSFYFLLKKLKINVDPIEQFTCLKFSWIKINKIFYET